MSNNPDTRPRCIVLDVDGTLADNIPVRFPENNPNYCPSFVTNVLGIQVRTPANILPKPIARPGLSEFLAFVFEEFDSVMIWTAAIPLWYEKVYREVLKPNLPPGKDFHFVKTRDQTKPYVHLKPLSEIYAKFPQYSSTNTLVVDDNPATFRDNVENAVHIPGFFYDKLSTLAEERVRLAKEDRGLYDAMEVIRQRLGNW